MFEFIDKIKDKYRQNRVEKLLNVQKSLSEIEDTVNVLEKSNVSYITILAQLKLQRNKLLKSEQSLQKEDPLFKSMYDHMRFESTYKEVTKGYRQGQIDLDRCDEILKAINNDKKVRYSDNLVFNTEGKLLLLKRSELDKTFPGMYTIPGGHVDAGEDHRTAAIRELQEESGLTPDKDTQFQKIGEYEDDKCCIEYFRSDVDKDNDTLTLQSEEAWQYEWVDTRELDKYEFPLNMKQNIQKMLFPNREIVQKLGKAFKNGKITREKFLQAVDILSKSQSHKYIRKEFKNGEWEYIYKEVNNSSKEIENKKLGNSGKFITKTATNPTQVYKGVQKWLDSNKQKFDVNFSRTTSSIYIETKDDHNNTYKIRLSNHSPAISDEMDWKGIKISDWRDGTFDVEIDSSVGFKTEDIKNIQNIINQTSKEIKGVEIGFNPEEVSKLDNTSKNILIGKKLKELGLKEDYYDVNRLMIESKLLDYKQSKEYKEFVKNKQAEESKGKLSKDIKINGAEIKVRDNQVHYADLSKFEPLLGKENKKKRKVIADKIQFELGNQLRKEEITPKEFEEKVNSILNVIGKSFSKNYDELLEKQKERRDPEGIESNRLPERIEEDNKERNENKLKFYKKLNEFFTDEKGKFNPYNTLRKIQKFERFPKGVDMENHEITAVFDSSSWIVCGGDWQQGINIELGLNDKGEIAIKSVFDSDPNQLASERRKRLKEVENINKTDLSDVLDIVKSFSHKYISKKPDGKGGWEYKYKEDKNDTKRYKSEVNSLGQKLGKTKEEIASFWQWFGDSKVVDKNGNPLVVFRGKSSSTSKIKSDNPYYISGLWFAAPSDDEDNYEEGNAEWVAEQFSDNSEIEKVYLKIENPKIYNDYEDLVDEVERKRGIDKFYESFKKKDGLHLIGSMTDGDVYRDDYVVFNKDQIKVIKDETQKSLQSINELYLQNKLSDELYEKIIEKAWKKSPIGTIVTRSNGQKWKKVSETGNKDQDWQLVGKPKTGSKADESVSKEKRAEYGTTGKQPTISEHAKESSETALNAAIKESQDPEVREAAHQELDRRQKEEHVQEDEKKDGGEKKDKLKEKIENLSDKYKNVMQEIFKPENYNSEDNYKKIENKQLELSRYIGRSNQFNGLDKEKEIQQVKDLLQLKDEKEIKSFFGDGSILGVKKQGDMTCMVLMEDGYCSRTFFEDGGVKMNEFILDLDVDKSKGKGTEIFSNQVKSFKEKGYKYLKTTAAKSNIYNGYYTWARLGYDIADKEGKKMFESVIIKSKDKDISQVKSLPELMSFQKGRDFWKQNGFQFEGKFDLSDKSKSMFVLNKYLKEKNG